MKKNRLAALAVAFALVLSLSVSAFALGGLSIGDFLQIVSSIDTSKYTEFNEQEWSTMTPAERAEQFNFVISDQKGTSKITENSDFINDSALSYKYYCGLINNSVINQGLTNNLSSKTYLEGHGLADFGLGFYNSNGHSSGKFGDGTVADSLNDDFLDYVRDNPIETGDTTAHFRTGDNYDITFYIDYDASSAWHKYSVKYRIIDPDGQVVLDGKTYKQLYSYSGNDINKVIFWLRRISLTDYNIVTVYKEDGTIQERFDLDPYIPNKEGGTVAPASDDPLATGTDENGNQIQFNINSDGVTYDGNTYNYNDDNSVTINGNTYYITVNPADVNEDYYNQFLQQVINNYYNYYNTDSTPFDGKDILTAVKSVFTSLETFRSYCYSQLKQIGDYISDGFNSMRASLKKIIDRLDDIIKYLKDISKNVEELTEDQEEKNKSDWADLISDFKDKVGWASLDKSMRNIQTAFFGHREYSVHSDTGEIQVQILQKDAAPLASSMPNLSITYMGQSYNLYSCVAYLGGDIEPIKQFISLFLWVGFILSVFRSIPSILGGVGALQKDTHFLSKDGD